MHINDKDRAESFAGRIEVGLNATDPRFRRSVRIVMDDGSSIFHENAFVLKWGDWILMFTEHHGFETFFGEDLLFCAEYERIHRQLEEASDSDVANWSTPCQHDWRPLGDIANYRMACVCSKCGEKSEP